MTDRRAVLLVVAVIVLVWLLARVSPTDSRQTPAWTVPPSAIVAITTSSGEQQMTPFDALASEPAGALPTLDSGYAPAAVSPRLPRGIGAEADHEAPTAPTAVPPTARPAASHSLAGLVRVGTASFYDDGPGMYAALPGPWRAGRWVSVCGPAKCITAPVVTSCVCGTHVIDLSPSLWEAVAGMNTAERWRYGVTPVSIVIEGGKP